MPTTEQISTAIAMRAQGQTQEAIAQTIGIPRPTLTGYLAKEDIQAKIKETQLRIINVALEKAVQNQVSKIDLSTDIIDEIKQSKEPRKGYKTILELADRAEGKLLESVGIHPSHTQSITLNNILIDNRVELSPVIEGMLKDRLAGQVIDVNADDLDD